MSLLLIGAVIGLALGLTGAGGSVLALPLLALALNSSVQDVTGIALAVVAFSAFVGVIQRMRSGLIIWLPASIIAVSGVLVAPLGQWLAKQLPPQLILTGFSILAVMVVVKMLHQSIKNPEATRTIRANYSSHQEAKPVCQYQIDGGWGLGWQCLFVSCIGGLLVGLLSGLFGVGGGFLIVPFLIIGLRLTMENAVATSLVIIALVSSSGFVGYLLLTPDPSADNLPMIAAGGAIGMLVGGKLGYMIAGPRLQQIFALSLVVLTTSLWINV